MAADPAQEDLTHDFGLRLLIEAHGKARTKSVLEDNYQILDDLSREMMPQEVTMPKGSAAAERVISNKEYQGRNLRTFSENDGTIKFDLDRNYNRFGSAARHYLYYLICIDSIIDHDKNMTSMDLAVAVRFSWLVRGISPGLLWESTAFSFVDHI
jgi:hypothetical protein